MQEGPACRRGAGEADQMRYRAGNRQVVEAIQKAISFDWKDSIIVNLVKKQDGVNITSRCVRHVRSGEPCSARCRERCWMEQ